MIAGTAKVVFGFTRSMVADSRHCKQIKGLLDVDTFRNDIDNDALGVDVPVGEHAGQMLRHAHGVGTRLFKVKGGGCFLDGAFLERRDNVGRVDGMGKPIDSNAGRVCVAVAPENKTVVAKHGIAGLGCAGCLVSLVDNGILAGKGPSHSEGTLRATVLGRRKVTEKDAIEFGQLCAHVRKRM